MSTIRIVYSALLIVGLSGAISFVGMYHRHTPHWWVQPVGRWLFFVPSTVTIILGFALLGRIVHVPVALWVIAFILFDIAQWYGVVVLRRAQKRNGLPPKAPERETNSDAAH